MKIFDNLTTEVLADLDPDGEAARIVISRDLMTDVIAHMSSDVEPCLTRKLVAEGYIGTVAPRAIAFWSSEDLPYGTVQGLDVDGNVLYQAVARSGLQHLVRIPPIVSREILVAVVEILKKALDEGGSDDASVTQFRGKVNDTIIGLGRREG